MKCYFSLIRWATQGRRVTVILRVPWDAGFTYITAPSPERDSSLPDWSDSPHPVSTLQLQEEWGERGTKRGTSHLHKNKSHSHTLLQGRKSSLFISRCHVTLWELGRREQMLGTWSHLLSEDCFSQGFSNFLHIKIIWINFEKMNAQHIPHAG